MTLPAEIRIGFIDYKIQGPEADHQLRIGGALSRYNWDDGFIAVRSDLPAGRRVQTFFEAVIRLLLWEAGTRDYTEAVKDNLGRLLHYFIKDSNLNWLQSNKLPEEVIINRLEYPIISNKETNDSLDTQDINGLCEYGQVEIWIHTQLEGKRESLVLLHEIIHALLHEAGVREHDEGDIVAITNVMYLFLTGNSFEWLKRSSVEMRETNKEKFRQTLKN